jgi:excisionase family DNA binding protein
MTALAKTIRAPQIPTEQEVKLAAESSRMLAAYIGKGDTARLRLIDGDVDITLPISAIHMLVNILNQMAQGHEISLVPVHAELTTQQAADMLNVSRPFLVKQLEAKAIKYHKTGRHRRIRFDDLMMYMRRIDEEGRAAVAKLASMAQEDGMGY